MFPLLGYNVTLSPYMDGFVVVGEGNFSLVVNPTGPPEPFNLAPVAEGPDSFTCFAGEEVYLSAALSHDYDGLIVNYTWHFGDGTVGYGVDVRHVYAEPGTYAGQVVVTDDDGATSVHPFLVVVNPRPPLGGIVWKVSEGVFYFAVKHPQEGVNYTWYFGDGCAGYGTYVEHMYPRAGDFTVLLISDNLTVNWTTVHADMPPVTVDADGPYRGYEGSPIRFTATTTGPVERVEWRFPDGSRAFGAEVVRAFPDDLSGAVTVRTEPYAEDSTTLTVLNVAPQITGVNITQFVSVNFRVAGCPHNVIHFEILRMGLQ